MELVANWGALGSIGAELWTCGEHRGGAGDLWGALGSPAELEKGLGGAGELINWGAGEGEFWVLLRRAPLSGTTHEAGPIQIPLVGRSRQGNSRYTAPGGRNANFIHPWRTEITKATPAVLPS